MRLTLTFSWVIDKAINHMLMKQISELTDNPYTHFDKDRRLHTHSCHHKDYFIPRESVRVHFHLKMRPCVSLLTQQVISVYQVPSVLPVIGHAVF